MTTCRGPGSWKRPAGTRRRSPRPTTACGSSPTTRRPTGLAPKRCCARAATPTRSRRWTATSRAPSGATVSGRRQSTGRGRRRGPASAIPRPPPRISRGRWGSIPTTRPPSVAGGGRTSCRRRAPWRSATSTGPCAWTATARTRCSAGPTSASRPARPPTAWRTPTPHCGSARASRKCCTTRPACSPAGAAVGDRPRQTGPRGLGRPRPARRTGTRLARAGAAGDAGRPAGVVLAAPGRARRGAQPAASVAGFPPTGRHVRGPRRAGNTALMHGRRGPPTRNRLTGGRVPAMICYGNGYPNANGPDLPADGSFGLLAATAVGHFPAVQAARLSAELSRDAGRERSLGSC